MPALETLVAKVNRVHGETHPELAAVESTFPDLAAEMHEHTEEEKDELFPVVGKLDRSESLSDDEAARLREAIRGFEDDLAGTAVRLDRIAELTGGYDVPEDACASYRSIKRFIAATTSKNLLLRFF
ncbi:hypothetical protein DVK00_14540 [Haloarcula sp. Atlit-47R]|nr:hypothetical protein DVK00_14540 [Haloarcula sp. Atlit-47R]